VLKFLYIIYKYWCSLRLWHCCSVFDQFVDV